MLCAEKGLAHSVRLLVGREAGMQDNSGWTALMNAAVSGKENVVPFVNFRSQDAGSRGEYSDDVCRSLWPY